MDYAPTVQPYPSHLVQRVTLRDAVRELSPRMLSQLTRVDYNRHLALIAVTERGGREL